MLSPQKPTIFHMFPYFSTIFHIFPEKKHNFLLLLPGPPRCGPRPRFPRQDIFTKLDINHNGALTRSELVKMPVAWLSVLDHSGAIKQSGGFHGGTPKSSKSWMTMTEYRLTNMLTWRSLILRDTRWWIDTPLCN